MVVEFPMVRVTWYNPLVLYLWFEFLVVVFCEASPKFHDHQSGPPIEVSMKVTFSGRIPDVVVLIKSAVRFDEEGMVITLIIWFLVTLVNVYELFGLESIPSISRFCIWYPVFTLQAKV